VRILSICVVTAVMGAAGAAGSAETWLGDAGHFLQSHPTLYALNPDGRAFTVTMHRHIWPVVRHNTGDYAAEIISPDGEVVATGGIPSGESEVTLDVPGGPPGVYRVQYTTGGYSLTWVTCSLDHFVAGTGSYELPEQPFTTFFLHAMAPRRWYFYVPQGVETFKIKHTIMPFQSHREDYGFFVMTPRGQRIAAFYGGKPLPVETREPNRPIPIEREIECDPGTTGRFWSIWVTGGDSHNFSDLQIVVDGVPRYFAPTPGQWFNPETGEVPRRLVYDKSQIRALDRRGALDAEGERLSRDHYRWAPAPYLGDEDYTGMRGAATVYVRNPEPRPVDFGVISYIIPKRERWPVSYEVFGPAGDSLLKAEDTYGHADSSRLRIPAAVAGDYRVDVTAEQWFAWTEPAVPMVLAGKPRDRGARFDLEIGIARHWFFKVPAGVEEFDLGLAVDDPDHVLLAEVHAPDRMVDVAYVRGGEPDRRTVRVPEALDDKIWFLRLEVGSATRFVSDDIDAPRNVRIGTHVTLDGVPPYLAPTWGQWFEPAGKKTK